MGTHYKLCCLIDNRDLVGQIKRFLYSLRDRNIKYKVYCDKEESLNSDWESFFEEINDFYVDVIFPRGAIRLNLKDLQSELFLHSYLHSATIYIESGYSTEFVGFRDQMIRLAATLHPYLAFSCSNGSQFDYISKSDRGFVPAKYYDTVLAFKSCFSGSASDMDAFYDSEFIDDYIWVSSPRRLGGEEPYRFIDVNGDHREDRGLKTIFDDARDRHMKTFLRTMRISEM
ncbi:hypothetical protein GCM10010844_39870 [Deinococcus radiotolerans]|uniref:Glycosyltransferase n=1 Tax=Deinococcus radiotolerans TaxID=1309407 RepID=A0ABQ2FQP0_9DEIO|nr:hypothetical protein GCM10010844_39870 [Deinococcus radiotolerans]